MLAGELASHEDPADAFAAYERTARPFVEANQNLALRENGSFLLPRTQQELDARNLMLVSLANGDAPRMQNRNAQEVHSSLRLADYSR